MDVAAGDRVNPMGHVGRIVPEMQLFLQAERELIPLCKTISGKMALARSRPFFTFIDERHSKRSCSVF